MFDETIAQKLIMNYNETRTGVLFMRSAKTGAVVVRTSVLTETPLH